MIQYLYHRYKCCGWRKEYVMQCAVKKFAESKENGLCLIDMPTGTGKTYQTRLIIESFLRGEALENLELLIYVTPLKKNIDDIYNQLQDSLKDKPELFDENVLRLYSNYECVLDNFLNVENQIQPSLKKKDSFKLLKNKIIAYKQLEEAGGFSRDILSTTLREIRTAYEPNFRHDLEAEIARDTKTEAERRKKINHDYSWVKILYPACLTKGKKVLFMTMDKFLFGNDPIVSKPYRFISHSKIKGALVFIDEFDATKDVVLNQEIERCTDYKIDIAKLFSGITSSLKNIPVPEALFAGSNDENDPKSSKTSFMKMKQKMLEVEKQYNLNYLFKLENVDTSDRYFLFDDYQLHTITSSENGGNIKCENNKELNQNIITLNSKKDDGYFYRAIYGMKGALNYFIRCCSMLSRNYMQNKNKEAQERHSDLMEIDQAVSTIISYFNLDSDMAKTLSALIVDDIALPLESRKRDMFSTDFYMNGFRYYDFNDDPSHDVSTTIRMCYLDNTPEKFILSLANKAKVVGLSATASIRSVTGNYDLEYITKRLGEAYYEITDSDRKRISDYVHEKLKCDYPIAVKGIGFENTEPDTIARSLFTNEAKVEKYKGKFEQFVTDDKSNPNYEINRVGKTLLAIKNFVQKKHSKVMLVLTNKNIKFNNEEDPFNLDLMNEFISDLSLELGLKKKPKIHYLFGTDFEKEKATYYEEVKAGEKVVLFSSYPAVGTGQNLQYELEENSGEDELKKKKDIDTIYVEEPTNIIVHRDNIKEEGELNKYIYQMETLRANGEISPNKSMSNIKGAFKKYMSPNSFVRLDRDVYQCESTNNHKVKILVQAVGRICRTEGKAEEVNIYVDNDILQKINFRLMKSRLMNPEFEMLINKSSFVSEVDQETKNVLNRAMDRNERLESRINNILSSNKDSWNTDDIAQWNLMRETVLKYPTISKAKLEELVIETGFESLKDFYLFEKEGRTLYQYSYFAGDKDKPKGTILLGEQTGPGWTLINRDNSRLPILLSEYAVREYFKKRGYATNFEKNEGIILPVIYQNIYKGALGEVAGRIILESRRVKLLEITDPNKFEKFDFCLANHPDIYIDFKNWSENDYVERQEYFDKCKRKLELVKGKKVYVINMYASEFRKQEEDNVVTVSTLFEYKKRFLAKGTYRAIVYDLNKVLQQMAEGK